MHPVLPTYLLKTQQVVVSASKFLQYKYTRCTEETCIHFILYPDTGKPSESSIFTGGMDLNSDIFNPVTELPLLTCVCNLCLYLFLHISQHLSYSNLKSLDENVGKVKIYSYATLEAQIYQRGRKHSLHADQSKVISFSHISC